MDIMWWEYSGLGTCSGTGLRFGTVKTSLVGT